MATPEPASEPAVDPIAVASARHAQLGMPIVSCMVPHHGKYGREEPGAMMLSPSPRPVGIDQQGGRLANNIIHEKVDPGAMSVVPPEGLDLVVNPTTRGRGTGFELAQRSLELAVRRSHPIEVSNDPPLLPR